MRKALSKKTTTTTTTHHYIQAACCFTLMPRKESFITQVKSALYSGLIVV